MPNYPVFFDHDAVLNDNGRKLANFLTVNLQRMMEASADELNTYPGPLKYLFTNHQVSGMTVEQFIRDNSKSAALNAWRVMEAIEAQEAQQQQMAETAETTSKLAETLELVMKELAEARQEIKALQEATTKPARKAKKEADESVDDEAENEAK